MTFSTQDTFTSNTRDLSLRDLIAPFFRRRYLLIIVFLMSMVLVVLAGTVVPPPYKAHMSILVKRERLDPLVSTEPTNQLPSNAASEVSVEEINSEAELLLSQDLLQRVVVSSGLSHKHALMDYLIPANNEEEKIERAVKKLAKKLTIKNETNSNIINVSYLSDDPHLSYMVLQLLGSYYVEKHAAVHRPPGSYQFFAHETSKYLDALKASEAKLQDFTREHGIAAPDAEETDLAQQVATSMGLMYAAEQAEAADAERIRSDSEQMRVTPQRSPTQQASTPADKLLDDLGSTLLAAQVKRTQLVLKYALTYPLVLEADQEITQAKSAIADAERKQYITRTTDVDPTYELLREDLARNKTDIAAQHATVSAAKKSVEGIRRQMVNLGQDALTKKDLEREAKSNEDNYLLYLAKREQERTSDSLDQTRIGNVAIAVPPAIPVLPLYSTPMVFLIGFGIALILSISTVYTFEYFDPSFHTPEQVTAALNIPVVISMSRKSA